MFRPSTELLMVSRFEGRLLDIESLSFILVLLEGLKHCNFTGHMKLIFSVMNLFRWFVGPV